VAGHKNSNHESTKGRKHERKPQGLPFFFVLSSFRAFVIGFYGDIVPVLVQSRETFAMLRLTRIAGDLPNPTVKLEGKLLGPWVDEVRQACAANTGPVGRTCLDLSALTFVDAAGVELLRELMRQGIEIGACSNYVAQLLRASAENGIPGLDPGPDR
jgi:hypothetical protein